MTTKGHVGKMEKSYPRMPPGSVCWRGAITQNVK